jgi:hypothetical protein
MTTIKSSLRYGVLLFTLITWAAHTYAQKVVEVRDEPFHKPVFQNEFIRLIDAIIPPGDTSLYHRHQLPSLFVFLEQTKIGMQDLGQAPGQMLTTIGQTWFNGYEKGPQIHRVWSSEEKTNLHAIDIEILKFNATDSDPVVTHASLELVVDSPAARIYKVTVPVFGQVKLKWNPNPVVVIPYTGSVRLNGKPLNRAAYKFVDKRNITLTVDSTLSPTSVSCYFYEIKT